MPKRLFSEMSEGEERETANERKMEDGVMSGRGGDYICLSPRLSGLKPNTHTHTHTHTLTTPPTTHYICSRQATPSPSSASLSKMTRVQTLCLRCRGADQQ